MPENDAQNDTDDAPEDEGIAGDLRRWRRVDDLEGLRMRVQRAMRTAETLMYSDGVSPDTRLSACRAVVSAAREARKMIEAVELEERVEELERDVALIRTAHTNGHTSP